MQYFCHIFIRLLGVPSNIITLLSLIHTLCICMFVESTVRKNRKESDFKCDACATSPAVVYVQLCLLLIPPTISLPVHHLSYQFDQLLNPILKIIKCLFGRHRSSCDFTI
jgi:hypothetical protein